MAVNWKAVAAASAERHGLDPQTFVKQINAESGFNPKAGSSAGAQGIAQIMPSTARGWGVDPWKPKEALDAAAKHMAGYVKQYGSYRDALVAYNAGPGRVGKPLYNETRDYIHRILGNSRGQTKVGQAATPRQTTRAASSRVPMPSLAPSSPSASSERFTTSQMAALAGVFEGNPEMQQVLQYAQLAGSVAANPTAAPATRAAARQAVTRAASTTGAPVTTTGGPGNNYRQLFKWAQKNFGAALDNMNLDDRSNTQTTGGKHATGSNHYADRAVDLGDAKNPPAKLRQIAAYARRNPGKFAEFYYNPLGWGIKNGRVVKGLNVSGHDNHLHMAVPA